MVDLRTALDAARGEPPSRELFDARAWVTGAQRRAARRCLRRGEAAQDAPTARLAVALARARLLGLPTSEAAFLLIVILTAVAYVVSDRRVTYVAVAVGVAAAFAALVLWPRQERAAAAADERNRAVLARIGLPYREDLAPAEPSRTGHLGVWLLLWIVRVVYIVPAIAVIELMLGPPYDIQGYATICAVLSAFLTVRDHRRARAERRSRGPQPAAG